jgi:N-acetylglutamate synthase
MTDSPAPATKSRRALVRLIEELSFNAQPSVYTLYYDGWLLRFADGYTRRANSVSPLYASSIALDEKIAYCEATYHAHEQPTIFKLTDATQPAELDETLARRGYQHEALTEVQALELSHVEKTPTLTDIWVDTSFKGQWLLTFCQMNTVQEEHFPVIALMLASIQPATCFLTLRIGQEAVAVGLAVLERGWLGIYDVVVAEHWRGQGVGYELMLHLLAWGKRNGAAYSYLQVATHNTAALALYQRLGYRQVYKYWYRKQ